MVITTWVICDSCEDMFCNYHNTHTSDCDCPCIEDWVERGLNPYSNEAIVDVEEFLA